ncbi:MAG: hypothetical protein QGI09_08240 [Dehalococcoidia bacterium]|nr:hypothetical protein [Dehalococcoidia bacterium]
MAQPRQIISADYPFLRVRVGIGGQRTEALALIDTGFDGAVAVPEGWLDGTRNDPEGFVPLQMADGSISYAPVFVGIVEIIGFPALTGTPITVLGVEYMLGREVIDLYRVTLDHGTRVIVEP